MQCRRGTDFKAPSLDKRYGTENVKAFCSKAISLTIAAPKSLKV
jgi:hypothetical protein